MSDNVTLPGTGGVVATDEVGGAHYQVVKIGLGAADAVDGHLDSGQQTMANSVPVAIASDQSAVAVSGPLTDAELRAADVKVSLDGEAVSVNGSVAVTGPLTDAELRAADVKVSLDGEAVSVNGSVAVTGPLTDTELRAADVKVTLDGEAVGISGSVPVTDGGGSLTVDGTVNAVVTSTDDVIQVTLTLDTNAYASGDVFAEFQEVANAVVSNGGTALLHSVTVLDEDDQGCSLELVFGNGASASLGTENSAVSISDADARTILGMVAVSAADYLDLGGCKIATKTNVGLVLEAGASSTSLYLGAIIRGAGTYSASGVRVTLGLLSRT